MIVELFATISVADVSPTLVTYGVIVLAQCRQSDVLPLGVRIFEQWLETDPFKLWIHRQSTEIDQCRIDTQQFNRLVCPAFDAIRHTHNERDVRCPLP